jgi:hypothetical protein
MVTGDFMSRSFYKDTNQEKGIQQKSNWRAETATISDNHLPQASRKASKPASNVGESN